MKLWIFNAENDPFERAKRLLERDLTPRERRWLILADELFKRNATRRFANKAGLKAA